MQVQSLQLRRNRRASPEPQVFDHNVRMAAAQVVQPIKIGAAVAEQASQRSGVEIDADAGDGVVVEFERRPPKSSISRSTVRVTCSRAAGERKSSEVPALSAYAQYPPWRWKNASSGRLWASGDFTPNHLRLEPQIRPMPCAGWCRPTLDSASPKRFVEACHSPTMSHQPPSVAVFVPAGVDAEDVRRRRVPRPRRAAAPSPARVAEQGVHVIVVDDEVPACVRTARNDPIRGPLAARNARRCNVISATDCCQSPAEMPKGPAPIRNRGLHPAPYTNGGPDIPVRTR